MHTAQTDQAERGHEARWLAREDEGGDDRLTEEGAREQAADETERTPEALAFWISRAVDGHARPEEAAPVGLFETRAKLAKHAPCTVAELLVVLLNSAEPSAIALRELMRASKLWRDDVEFRAAELLEAA